MHIPKTANTLFKDAFLANFEDEDVFPLNEDLKANNGLYPKVDELDSSAFRRIIQDKKLFHGHYPYSIYNKLHIENSLKLSFLRDPIRRAISHLKELKSSNPEFNDLTMSEILDSPKLAIPHFDNLQTRYFLSGSPNNFLEFQHLQNAKQNLSKFDFIGVIEEMELSLKLLKSKFDLSIKYLEDIKSQENELNFDGSLKIDEDLLLRIYDLNKLDIELYNFALRKLEEQ